MPRPRFPELLLEDQWSPMTVELGFLETDARTAVDAFVRWCRPIYRGYGDDVREQTIFGDLKAGLGSLLPLTSVKLLRYLFVPTASSWTAYFDNGYLHPDAGPKMSFLGRTLGCRWVRVVVDPHRIGTRSRETLGASGMNNFTLYDRSGPGRTISVRRELGRWKFSQFGDPLPFEDLARYRASRAPDRLTWAMVGDYCRAVGIELFDERCYMPSGVAHLVERFGPGTEGADRYSLEEAQRFIAEHASIRTLTGSTHRGSDPVDE